MSVKCHRLFSATDLLVHNIIQAAASCYIELIVKESDNNVKLIVLDRLVALKEVPSHEKVLQVNTVPVYTGEYW